MANNSSINWSYDYDLLMNNTCLISKTINSWSLFAYCYTYHFNRATTKALLEIFLAFGAFASNLLVIILLGTKKTSTRMSVFDKIIIGHSFVDGLTGLIDMPLFHLNSLFGYWPLTPVLSHLWSSYDNNINTTTSLHMLYMSYVRLRSIQSPKNYMDEYLIRYPVLMMTGFWIIGLTIWTPVVYSYGVKKYTLDIDFGTTVSVLKVVLNFITWFIPLLIIFLISAQIVYLLNIRKKVATQRNVKFDKKKSTNGNSMMNTSSTTNTKRKSWNRRLFRYCFNYRLSAQSKFMIIISTYWIQWFIPCFLTVFNPICNYCIDGGIYLTIYWSTFTVCLVDPIIVLILNPNVSCMRS